MNRLAWVGFLAVAVGSMTQLTADEPQPQASYTLNPIGRVEKEGGKTTVVLDKKYQAGLGGLDTWSHVWVIWWLDKNDTPEKRSILQVHPRGNPKNPLSGIFATRNPTRPNLIALTLCKIVAVKDNIVEIDTIDAFAGSPVLDLKPYNPKRESIPDAKVADWAK